MRLCSDGCGKYVSHYDQECYPKAPWDLPDAPPRARESRCRVHALCAYRDDDPNRCAACHRAKSIGCFKPDRCATTLKEAFG